MAKMKYGQNLEFGLDNFQVGTHLVKSSGKQALWVDSVTDATMKLKGKGFEVSDSNGDYLSAGIVRKLVVKDGDGDLVVSVSDLNVKATRVFDAFEKGGFEGVVNFISKGDDRQIGSKHDDLIFGGGGDDVMTGKGGSDLFIFNAQNNQANAGPEHDVITDFDIKGADADRIFFDEGYKLKAVHGGDDTLVKFDSGSTLLLEDVKKTAFEDYLDTIMNI